MNWELLRSIASWGVIAIFALWIRSDDEKKKLFNPRNYPQTLRSLYHQARGMTELEWSKFLAVGLTFTFLALLIVPMVPALMQDRGGVKVSNEDHPVNQISSGTKPVMGVLILGLLLGTIPILEEWLFRRNLLEWIRQKDFNYSTLSAIIVSSFAFGSFHLLNSGTYIYSLVPPFFGGLLFGVAYVLGGLKASCFSHVAYNELILVIMYAPVFL